MWIYSVVMFFVAMLFLSLGTAVYKGRTDLIHSYHQTRVTDKLAYGRALGKCLFVIAAAMLLSGITGLLGDSDGSAMIAVAVLVTGMGIGFGCMVTVQRKYNKGIF